MSGNLDLSAVNIPNLTREQLATVTPDKLAKLSAKQIWALSPQQLQMLTPEQTAGFLAGQLSVMNDAQKAVLPAVVDNPFFHSGVDLVLIKHVLKYDGTNDIAHSSVYATFNSKLLPQPLNLSPVETYHNGQMVRFEYMRVPVNTDITGAWQYVNETGKFDTTSRMFELYPVYVNPGYADDTTLSFHMTPFRSNIPDDPNNINTVIMNELGFVAYLVVGLMSHEYFNNPPSHMSRISGRWGIQQKMFDRAFIDGASRRVSWNVGSYVALGTSTPSDYASMNGSEYRILSRDEVVRLKSISKAIAAEKAAFIDTTYPLTV
jgi:hypothetical protein